MVLPPVVSAIVPVVSTTIIVLLLLLLLLVLLLLVLLLVAARPRAFATVPVLLIRRLLRLHGPIPAVTPAPVLLLLPWKLGLVEGGRRSHQTVLPGMLKRLVATAV